MSLAGGQNLATVPVGAGTTVVKASQGRLARISVTTAGTTGTITFYDNPTTGSGTVLFVVPTNAALGTIYDIQLPALTGITAVATASGPGVTVGFN